MTKTLFQIMLYEAPKFSEKLYLLMQNLKHKTTRSKRSSGYILQIIVRSTFKTSNTMQKGCVIFIWFWLVFHPPWFCPLRTGGGRGGFLINGQNALFDLYSVVLISSSIMWNIRNEVDKTFVRNKQIDRLICNISIMVYGMICRIIDKRL